MQPGKSATPLIIALIVASVGTAMLLNMDFGSSTAVQNDGLNKISLAVIANAGATAAPTVLESE